MLLPNPNSYFGSSDAIHWRVTNIIYLYPKIKKCHMNGKLILVKEKIETKLVEIF